MSDDVWIYDEPRRGIAHPVICEHCCGEIEAYGEWAATLILHGSRPYLWRHVETGSDECTLVRKARPYDDFAAHRVLTVPATEEAQ